MSINNKNNKKKKFKLFDFNRDGKGAVEENRKPTFLFFFKLLFRKFPKILSVNLLMLVQVIPFIVILLAMFLGPKLPTSTNVLFAPAFGITQAAGAPFTSVITDISSIHMGLPIFSPAINITIICLLVILAITWGWQNVGAAYVLRGFVKGDAVFIFSDFFYAIKRNLKQGFILGLIDFGILGVLVLDFIFLYQQTGSFKFDFMYIAILILFIIYFIMRFYLYTLLVTFDLKIFQIIKNAFIFSLLGIGRNILALLGIVLLVVLNALLIWFTVPMGFSVPIILPFFYLLGVIGFMAIYAAYPVIDKYMIAPYVEETNDDFIYFKEPTDDENGENDKRTDGDCNDNSDK